MHSPQFRDDREQRGSAGIRLLEYSKELGALSKITRLTHSQPRIPPLAREHGFRGIIKG